MVLLYGYFAINPSLNEQKEEVVSVLREWLVLLMILLIGGCASIGDTQIHSIVPRMSKDQLKVRLGSTDIIVLDVRTERDWSNSEEKITGANREDPKLFDSWSGKYPKEKTLVLYCA
jgi:hypothetical protein